MTVKQVLRRDLPAWIAELAIANYKEQGLSLAERTAQKVKDLVDVFVWNETPEGFDFWFEVYQGNNPESPADVRVDQGFQAYLTARQALGGP